MIIRSIRHKQFLANYSVNYLFDGMSKERENQWLIFQNISRGFDHKSIIQEFNDNSQYLSKMEKRKRVYRYHEILAFAHEDSRNVTREKLQRIVNKYLSLRDPKGLSKVVCVPHLEDGKHPHCHLLLSSNFIQSPKSGDMRMDNEQYYDLRRTMERWVLRTLPELHRSTVYLSEPEIRKILPEKYRSERRLMQLEKPTKKRNYAKEKVAETIKEILAKSNSLEEFVTEIEKQSDYRVYSRKGKITGVIHENKKRYRFSILGIPLLKENFRTLKRMSELQQLRKRNEREKERDKDSLER